MKTGTTSRVNIRLLVMSAMLAVISFILAFFEFPVPLSPAFVRIDLSDLPALIGAFAFGPLSGVLIEFIKNAMQVFSTSTGGVGELANFIMGSAYVATAGIIYKRHKTKRVAWISCICASFAMAVTAMIMNYFVLLPMFEMFMPMDQLIASFTAFIPFIHTKLDVVLFSAFPSNLAKGLLIGFVTMLVYKKISPLLKG